LTGDITGWTAVLRTYIDWVSCNDPAVETPPWRLIATNLEKRWAATLATLAPEAKTDPAATALTQFGELSDPTTAVLNSHVGAGEYLRFARRQLAEGPAVSAQVQALLPAG
jgi:hypothetical protein